MPKLVGMPLESCTGPPRLLTNVVGAAPATLGKVGAALPKLGAVVRPVAVVGSVHMRLVGASVGTAGPVKLPASDCGALVIGGVKEGWMLPPAQSRCVA